MSVPNKKGMLKNISNTALPRLVQYEGTPLHKSCRKWSYNTGRRANRGDRSKRDTTAYTSHQTICSTCYGEGLLKVLMAATGWLKQKRTPRA